MITDEFVKLLTIGIAPETILTISGHRVPDALPKEYIYIKYGGIDAVWKIGKTVDIERRRKDYQCGLAAPVVFEYVYHVYNCTNAENLVKRTLTFCKYNNIKQNELYTTTIEILSQLVLDACMLSNKADLYSMQSPNAAAAAIQPAKPMAMAAAIEPIPDLPTNSTAAAAAPPKLSFLASAFAVFSSSAPVALSPPTLVCIAVERLRERTPKLNSFAEWIALPTSVYIGYANTHVAGTRDTEWRNIFKQSTADLTPIAPALMLEKYKHHIKTTPALLAAIATLSGKELGCFCRDPTHCHGRILIELWHEWHKANKK